MHVFGMWEETGVPGGNPRTHGDNMQTPQMPNGDSNPELPDLTPTAIDMDSQVDTTDAPDSGAAGGDFDILAENTTPAVTGSPSHNQEAVTTPGPSGAGDDDNVVMDLSDHFHVKTKPLVECVGKEEIEESKAVKAVVTTTNCEDTKALIQNSSVWCHTENCRIKVYQEGNDIRMVRNDARQHTLAEALKGELKDKLGVANVEAPSSSSSSNRSVFVGILITGLLVAATIVAAYCKCQRKRNDSKGVKLAEEAYPVNQENQGNTLVSVAPLNPPAETQEKPNVNGESPEAAKTESTPPTNGHSATKTADTEL